MNEPPKEVKVGVPIFWKTGMEWVIPKSLGGQFVYFDDAFDEHQGSHISGLTYSPGIPPEPVEMVDETVEVLLIRSFGTDDISQPQFVITIPFDSGIDLGTGTGFFIGYRCPKREGE